MVDGDLGDYDKYFIEILPDDGNGVSLTEACEGGECVILTNQDQAQWINTETDVAEAEQAYEDRCGGGYQK